MILDHFEAFPWEELFFYGGHVSTFFLCFFENFSVFAIFALGGAQDATGTVFCSQKPSELAFGVKITIWGRLVAFSASIPPDHAAPTEAQNTPQSTIFHSDAIFALGGVQDATGTFFLLAEPV